MSVFKERMMGMGRGVAECDGVDISKVKKKAFMVPVSEMRTLLRTVHQTPLMNPGLLTYGVCFHL